MKVPIAICKIFEFTFKATILPSYKIISQADKIINKDWSN